jgi:hypothetical protein
MRIDNKGLKQSPASFGMPARHEFELSFILAL